MSGARWLKQAECRIDEFATLVERTTRAADAPLACEIRGNVPVYDCSALRRAIEASPEHRAAVMAEWGDVMLNGAGLIVLAGAFSGSAWAAGPHHGMAAGRPGDEPGQPGLDDSGQRRLGPVA